MSQNGNQTQNQQANDAEAKKLAEKQAAEAKAKAEKLDLEIEGKYEEYVKLKFIVFDGGKLKEQHLEKLKKLESEIKEYKGKIAKKTVTAAIGTFVLKMVERMPIPPSYAKILKDNGVTGIYVK